MTSAAWELQKAIYSQLRADTDLRSLISNPVRCYDEVPEREQFPYIVIDEPSTLQWDTTGDYGKEHSTLIHVWSDYEGKKELNLVMDAIERSLREFSPSLTNHNVVNFRLQMTDRLKESDEQVRHGVMQFRVVTEETA